ncbi:MAG: hypothetical protein WBD28_00420 [Candidatus Zixiibacteriota bacterium]
MLELKIERIQTKNQRGENATLFDPFGDALTLIMDIKASPDLMDLPKPMFMAVFQIIDPLTDIVVVNQTWLHEFQWGPNFWISMGNNWGPDPSDYTTPKRWGLEWWKTGSGVFGFRGIIKAYSSQKEKGMITVDAFDVSGIRWFRLKEIYAL